MPGKPRELLTWLGKSDRPVATILRARLPWLPRAKSRGSGWRRRRRSASLAILLIHSFLITSGPGLGQGDHDIGAFHRLGDVALTLLGVGDLADVPFFLVILLAARVASLVQGALGVHMMILSGFAPAAMHDPGEWRCWRRPRRSCVSRTLSIFLPDDLQGVDEPGHGHGRGALLVIVPDGDLGFLAQRVQDVEALGLGDILQVDAAEAGLRSASRSR